MKADDTLFQAFLRRLRANRLAMAGAAVVALLIVLALFAPLIAPHDPHAINVEAILLPPSPQHLFGTDELGRDVFSRMIFGARVSLQVGFVAAGLATLVGVILGALAGYYGGKVEALIMRFTDMMLCFPTFFLILAVIALLEPSIINIMAVIGLTSWMGVARLVRAEFFSLPERDSVVAARSLGASPGQTFFEVTFPLLMPAIFAGALFAFTISFDNITATIFWRPSGLETVPTQIFGMLRHSVSPEINALGFVMICITVGVPLLAGLVARRFSRKKI